MRLYVKFLATLYDLTGVLKTQIEVNDGITVRELLEVLSERFPKLKQEILDERGELKPMYNILVNGRAVEWLNGLNTTLKDGDEIVFIPPAAGG